MAVVVYRCTVCKREIELQQNREGLERAHHCNITQHCRGSLYQVNFYSDYIRGGPPTDVVGLNNWNQRNILYTHEQGSNKESWVIQHNLGTYPAITVYVSRPSEDIPDYIEKIEPADIIVIDPNTIILNFERAYSGIAQLLARQTEPTVKPVMSSIELEEPTTELNIMPLSNEGEMTIATKIASFGESTNVEIQLTYYTIQNTTHVISFLVDDQPSIASPWHDFNKVIINGKSYVVRSFTAIPIEITNGVISNGSTCYISGINTDPENSTEFTPIANGDIVFLLATPPQTIYDKITTTLINSADIATDENTFAIVYDNGEYFVDTSTQQRIYPPIRSV
jgi:hypothetical protein